ncbi:MAG: hypothetical protein OEV78_01335 [Spirochaetia bacterium]|nr:hypothetical protein [Spirochaetia bacterium]
MNGNNNMEVIDAFFKPQNLNTSKNKLTFQGNSGSITYERMYTGYYNALFNLFKGKIPLKLPEDHNIKKSSWEPLLKAGHHGFIITLKNFLMSNESKSEMGKLMMCFDLLQHHGFGNFELGLAPKDSFMKISVENALEDSAFDIMENKPAIPVSAFTAGIVLACYNISMTSMDISSINDDDLKTVDQLYLESPEIIQVEYGSISNQESGFTLHAKQN